MCGFVGVLNLDGQAADAALLSRMSQEIAHRGPDDQGVETSGPCGLGFRRLSIIDLSAAGHQPMRSADERLTIVFNGEIYNYRELRDELAKDGARFRSHSDTEVLLHLYERYGTEMLSRLRGMFAFAIWDARERSLVVARDRVGIKPLYYLLLPGERLYVASEIKAIIADPRVKREVEPRALMQYLYFGHSSAPLTMFAGIEKLPAGHLLEVKAGRVSKRKYWDVLDAGAMVDRDSAPAVVRDLLKQAVGSHMVSDVPVGAFLSGGIDSSAVVAFMSEITSPVETFSVGFDVGGGYNELSDAQRIATKFGARHHELTVTHADAMGQIEKLVHHYDEPFADAAALPTYLVSRFARDHVKVVMSGEGSDELLGGYRRYVLESLADKLHRAPKSVRGIGQRLLASWGGGRRATRRLAAFLDESPEAERYGRFLAQMDWELVAQLLRPDVLDSIGEYDPLWKYKECFARAGALDHVNRLLYTDFSTWMVDTYLEKVDKASMAVGLEARVPFLDHKLAEASFGIAGADKIRGFVTKRPLKRALLGTLPLRTLFKPKHGFSVPIDEWFRGPLKSFVKDTLLASDARAAEWLEPATIASICDGHFSGTRSNGTAIWILLNFELWARHYLH